MLIMQNTGNFGGKKMQRASTAYTALSIVPNPKEVAE